MEMRRLNLPIGSGRHIRVVLGIPRTASMDAVLILGHGANNNMEQPLIAGVHGLLARQGVVTARFNFPYAEEGRKKPDSDDILEGVFHLVIEYLAESEEFKGLEIYLGGKSMGARLAAQLVSQDVGASGLVFLGYPLHPPGKPEKLHDQPLYSLPCPALFIIGGRDPFCHLDRLGQVVSQMPMRTDLHIIPGAGHSLETGKEPLPAETIAEVSRVILGWLDSL